MQASKLTALVLAGGMGRRMGGEDKGLLLYEGKPLIEHVLSTLSNQVDEIIINANRNIQTYRDFGFRVVQDETEDFQGPLAGFLSGMEAVKSGRILTAPCDGPKLPDNYAQTMLGFCTGRDLEIIVAHDGSRVQPVHALIPVALKENLAAFLSSGGRKIDAWYGQHPLIYADFSERPNVFYNVNQPEQIQH